MKSDQINLIKYIYLKILIDKKNLPMAQVQLDDLVYTYPEQQQPGFQTLISSKEEFRKTASGATEPVPRRGELFKHQQYLLRLLRQYDDQLIIWRTGTGKSCGVIAVTEYYKSIVGALENIRADSTSPYRHAYVLVKGPSLIEEFKFQLVCNCTDGDYITDLVKNSTTEKQRKGNVTRAIKSFYTITTYGMFARDLAKLTDEQIRQEFDHSIFIIDEVHNLRIDPEKGHTIEDPNTGNKIVVQTVKKGGQETEVIVEQRLVYDQLHRAFHTLSPRKVMLLSATPMINDASEISPVMNLILPLNKQLPLNVDYNQLTLQQIEPYFRGMISYVRELATGAIPVYQGEVIDAKYNIQGREVPSQMVVYATQMSEHQAKTYNLAVENPKALRPGSDRPEAFADLQRQAANFVFPDGSAGSDGFRRYVVKQGDGIYVANETLSPWLKNMEYLRTLSSKFADIVQITRDTPGNSWCYSNFVIGSGAILLSLCFEAQGFEKFSETSSIFQATAGVGLPQLCAPERKKGIERNVRIPKKLRYALLTSETPSPEADAMLEAFNSYENRHGEYIKAIIGSPVTRDGLNLANVLQIHLVGPGWNQASTYQAESRAIRSTSHVDLIAEERERLRRLGQNPDNAYVDIRVYRHASITAAGTSIDLHMYQLSEVKDREIKRIMRMMKQVSTDCQIHYNRNVRPNDIDGSSTCDYDVCAYQCYDPRPTDIDYTSYDVLYTGDIVDAAASEIKEIFHIEFNMDFNELYKRLKHYRPRFIDEAVVKLIEDKIPIIDRYGYTSYLREDKGSLFLRRDFPMSITEKPGGYSLSIYTETLIGIQKISLNDYIGELQKGEQVQLIQELQKLSPESPEFNRLIDNLNLENKVDLLESSVYQLFVNQLQSPAIRAIIMKYQTSVFQVPEPTAAIQITAHALANRGKGRGRKPKVGAKFKLTAQQQEEMEKAPVQAGSETVYIHTLFNQAYDRTSYAVSSKFSKADGRIRLLKPSEGVGWRDANPYELPVYNTIVQRQLEDMKNQFEQYEIYGLILEPDRKFRIRDKTTEATEAATTDQRKVNRGRVCEIWNKPSLVDLLWKLKVMPFKTQVTESREELIGYLERAGVQAKDRIVAEFSDDKLRFFYIWYRTGMNRTQICNILQQEMQKMGRLLVM
jgi:hypothetical protein